jgi:uncharacterized protein
MTSTSNVSVEDIEFCAAGTTLRGWFVRPAHGDHPRPCVILQHGFAGVKEMHLRDYAERFAAAGLSALVYDHPGFGASDAVPGTPRQEIDPWQQVRGIQHAITYAQSRQEVQADRIGMWGSSYGGGHALVVAAIDRRVKAVVAQVPAISGSATFSHIVRIDQWAAMDAMFEAERLARMAGAEPTMIPVVTADPMAPAALPMADAYEFMMRVSQERAPGWLNEVTVSTMEHLRGYNPADFVPLIAPTPLLLAVGQHDRVSATELGLAAFEAARHPKKLQMLPGGHFDAYDGQGFEASSSAAAQWFCEHLL